MRNVPIALGALALLATAAFAADDPIAARQALMDNNGAATAVAGGILKDQIAYSPAVAKAVITSWNATAAVVGGYFPEGSADAKRSHAAPKIWEDMAGFQAALAKFQDAAFAAAKASGKDGPADKAAFAKLAQPVMQTCKGCHQDYRLEN